MSKVPGRPTSWSLRAIALLVAFVLVAAACGDSDDSGSDSESSDTTTAEAETTEAPASDATEAPAESAGGGAPRDFAALAAPSGEPMVIGMVNTEGPAGLNFPEIRTVAGATVDYLNEHGGFGGRPVELEVCVADSSPESSQACAQELVGKNAEMVFLGLDLFPDYPTYDAAGVPLVGVLPLFPADFAAEAIYLNGGNATLAAGITALAATEFEATNVAVVSADNPGANGSEASLLAALDAAGIAHRSIKGSDNETDAGFQGLVREALSEEPDLLISLYGDAGCIGMMRGRAALGSDIVTIAANTCAAGEVIEVAGDDADGWYFVGGGDQDDTAEFLAVKEAVAPAVDLSPEEVSLSDLGLGGLSHLMFFTMAAAANELADSGGEVTGQGIYDYAKANDAGTLRIFPEGGPLDCGAAAAYPSVCVFTVPIGTYAGDGQTMVVPGLEQLSVVDFLA